MRTTVTHKLTAIFIHPIRRATPTYFSLFSGIGGFEIPLEELGFTCVGYSEIDYFSRFVYERHFPSFHNYGDVTRIEAAKLPSFDFLCGGFPCQSFSIAGKRRGFDDIRGTLFFEIIRILRAKRPSHFLLENVKGLLSHENGITFKVIIAALAELGYGVEWQVLDSQNFSVPQRRERVFIAGHLGEACCRQVFPLAGEHAGATPKPSRILAKVQPKGGDTNRPHANGQRFPKEHRKYLHPGSQIRCLTPLECERLQGFPDGWTEGISEQQRYKCLGNAVTVNVVRAIAQPLAICLRLSLFPSHN